MSEKKFTTEELKKQCQEAMKTYNDLNEQLKKQEQEEEEERRAYLALEKEAREKEIRKAYDHYQTLLKTYVKDYGSLSITTSADEWPSFFKRWWF